MLKIPFGVTTFDEKLSKFPGFGLIIILSNLKVKLLHSNNPFMLLKKIFLLPDRLTNLHQFLQIYFGP